MSGAAARALHRVHKAGKSEEGGTARAWIDNMEVHTHKKEKEKGLKRDTWGVTQVFGSLGGTVASPAHPHG